MPELADYVDKQFTERELDLLAESVLFETEEERAKNIEKIISWASMVRTDSDLLNLILQEKVLTDFKGEELFLIPCVPGVKVNKLKEEAK